MELFKLLGTIAIDNTAANKALDETSNKGNSAKSKLSTAFGAIGKGAAVVGKAIGTAMVAGGAAMTALTVKALNLSGELEQNMGGSEAVFGEYADSIQAKAREAFSNMGLSTSEYLGTANKMGALFQGAGFSIEESMNLSSSAMQRAADVASIMGIDTSAAMEAIAGAAKGNFTMMDNLGVAMNDTTLQAYALEKGISKSTSEMTNQEKIGLAMEMFMEKTAYATGNYAKENETLAGSLGTAKAALTNFLDGSGSVDQLVDSFSNAAKVIVKNISEIAPRLATGIAEVISKTIPLLPPLIQQTLPAIIEGATSLLISLAQMLPELAVVLLEQIPVIVGQIRSTLENQFPQLAAPFSVIEGLFNGVWESAQIIWESAGKPIFDAIKEAFSSAKDALEPFTSAFSDYVTNGGFAKDATEAVSKAVDVLKGAYEGVSGFIETVVGGFKDAVEWGKEHENILTVVAIAVGTLTGAIAAYNIAMAIKNAGGIVEIAQLAATAIGVGALTVAETAHSVASTVAAAATTAFGAAVSFLTSPITLVIVAIGALIAIGVLLYKNWDEIKAKCSELYSNLKEKFSQIKEAIANKVEEMKAAVVEKFNALKTAATEKFNSLKTAAVEKFNSLKTGAVEKANALKTAAVEKFNSLKTSAIEKFNSLKTGAIEKFNSLKTSATSKFNEIKSAITKPIETARDTIKGIVDKIKGFFSNLNISFPHIPLPHFSISPSGWSIGDLLEGSIPSLSIDWYAKAMKNPIIMNSPTIFGYDPATGSLMGGGEAGSEVVSGTDTLMQMIGNAVEAKMSAANQQIIKLLTAMLATMEGGNKDLLQALLAGHTIKINEREFARTVREYA